MHPDVAQSLNNLAGLYRAQGAYPKAEPLFVRALAIREKALGPMHPLVANTLNNLARLYQAQGASPKAEPCCRVPPRSGSCSCAATSLPSRSRASER